MRIKKVPIVLAVLSLMSAQAYETSTHRELTFIAYDRSILGQSPSFMRQKLDFLNPSAGYFSTRPGESAQRGSARSVMGSGAILEDELYPWIVCNHFMDPQSNNFEGRPLTGNGHPSGIAVVIALKCGINGRYTSMDWALDRRILVDPESPSGTHGYTYRTAQNNFYQALTAPTLTERWKNEGLIYQTLGHIAHHLQDMGQPQHTRNEAHAHGVQNPQAIVDPAIEVLGGGNPRYELYTAEKNSKLGEINGMYSYPIPTFDRAENFWVTPGRTSAKYVGMAEFTSQNFATPRHPYRFESDDLFGPFNGAVSNLRGAPDYPLPNAANPDGIGTKFVAGEVGQAQTVTSRLLQGRRYYLVGSVYDGYTNQAQIRKLAVVSRLFNLAVAGATGVNTFTTSEDNIVHDEMHKVLLPRAVAFSAGVINFFFRGNLTLIPPTSGATYPANQTWTLRNDGQEAISGNIAILAENGAAIRAPLKQVSASLAPGQVTTFTIDSFTSNTLKVIAAFKGQIGQEGSVNVDGVVTGNVISYQPQLPTISVSRSPVPYVAGTSGILNWSSTNASSVSVACAPNASQGYSENRTMPTVSGSTSVSVLAQWGSTTSNCTWTASGPGGNSTYSETVSVAAPPPPPIPCSGPLTIDASTAASAPFRDLTGRGTTPGKITVEVLYSYWQPALPSSSSPPPPRPAFDLRVSRVGSFPYEVILTTNSPLLYQRFDYDPNRKYLISFFAPPNVNISSVKAVISCPR